MARKNVQKLFEVSSMLRWPGSKWRFRKFIVPIILSTRRHVRTFIEPCAGGASIALEVASLFPRILLNDADWSVYALWSCIADPRLLLELVRLIAITTPSKDLFTQCKTQLNSVDLVTAGYACLMCNRMSFGGRPTAGHMSDPTARFNKERLIQKLLKIGSTMSGRLTVTNLGCHEVIKKFGDDKSFFYVDCPYIVKGNALYRSKFSTEDHITLARVLKECPASFLASYDDHPLAVENFSGWCETHRIPVSYRPGRETEHTNELLFYRPNSYNLMDTHVAA